MSPAPSTVLTRFILQKDYYHKVNGTVKWVAFMPNQNRETSVFLTTDLNNKAIWSIGFEIVARPTNRTLRARADIDKKTVEDTGLRIQPETSNHPFHANLVDWPDERIEQKQLALELAQNSRLFLAPSQ
jgi:hypothetical protein